ncbi:MAG: uracil phosphoribosyltransferase [Armatimonadetes bacterium]|nr:uracil phosphoribosyltransferase [Armatimonadota bacterium]
MAVVLVDHPLVQHKLSILRDKRTGPKEFRELIEELSSLIAYEATRNLSLEMTDVETPLEVAHCRQISGKKLGLIPILRAGLGMIGGILRLVPAAKVGHLGMYRDPKTLQPVDYYYKIPEDLPERDIFLLDPMLATGGSAVASVKFLRDRGARTITFMGIIASREGIRALQEAAPDVDIYTAAIDEELNDHGYIVPGLGDAGDRLFGTE